MHSSNTFVMEHENPKMTLTRFKFRRVGECINRIATVESRPVSRYPDPTPAELREFKAMLAGTGVDIGGGAYPTPDSVAFRGPGHKITDYLVINGKVIAPEVLRREDQARAARTNTTTVAAAASATAPVCTLQRSYYYAKRAAKRRQMMGREPPYRLRVYDNNNNNNNNYNNYSHNNDLQPTRVYDNNDLVWWCDYMHQVDEEDAEEAAAAQRRLEEWRQKKRQERKRLEDEARAAQQQQQRSFSFSSVDSRRCRLSMRDENDYQGTGGSSSETLYSRPAGSQHGYYWNMPGEMGALRVTNPDPVADEDEA